LLVDCSAIILQRYLICIPNVLFVGCLHLQLLDHEVKGFGEGYTKIIAIDAGNCSDVYRIVDLARQYGLQIKKVLQNIIVSRAFTIYQLAHLVIDELPKIIERLSFDRKDYIIVIYGLLHLFVSDPHIDRADAKELIKEIASSIRKLSEDRFVAVSTTHCSGDYEGLLFPIFENVIRISNDIESSRLLHVSVHNQIRRIGGKGFRSAPSTKLCNQELSLVPPR
jgi:Rad51